MKAGNLDIDLELKSDGEQKMHSELMWKLNDGKGTASTENFEMSGLLFLSNLVDNKWSIKREQPRTNLDFMIEFPKLDSRKVTATAAVVKESESRRKVNAELAWDALRDVSKKLVVESDVDLPTAGRWEFGAKLASIIFLNFFSFTIIYYY